MKLQVVDWNKHFENNKSRLVDECSFVCVPNKQHGFGLTRVLSEPDGAAIYGVWCLILGVCSRQRKPREGYLTVDGRPDGASLVSSDLALNWRRTVIEVERAISFLSSDKVGWIKDLDESHQSARTVPSNCPSGALNEGKEGREEKEEKEPPAPVALAETAPSPRRPKSTSILPPGFLRFWQAWPGTPRKVGRHQCVTFWSRNECEEIADQIVGALNNFKKTSDWIKDHGQYIPMPLTWLRANSWEAPVGFALIKQREKEQDEICGVTSD